MLSEHFNIIKNLVVRCDEQAEKYNEHFNNTSYISEHSKETVFLSRVSVFNII